MARSVLFRADAAPALGIGHVMRCRTLAAELAGRGWTCRLACDPLTLETLPGLADGPFVQIVEATEPDALRRLLPPPDWLVVDHYRLDRNFEADLAGWARHILVLDDLADRPHHCDLLLDQTVGGSRDRYRDRVAPGTLVLAGPRHALVRPEFRPLPASAKQPLSRLLISMGGTDPVDATSLALEALRRGGLGLPATVVLGGRAPHLDKVRALAASLEPPAALLVDVADMATVMRQCQLAVGAAGTSALERLCLGLPTLTVVTAGNQALVAEGVAEAGAGLVVPLDVDALATALRRLAEDQGMRDAMAEKARALCDGRGAARLATLMGLDLRPAGHADGATLLDWRNDPLTRANSLDTAAITSESHFAWLDRVLADPARLLLMAEQDGVPVATIRFDRLPETDAWRVSIAVAPDRRAGGLGEAVLALGGARLQDRQGPSRIIAQVRPENAASLAIFAACGYVRLDGPGDVAELEWRP